MRHFVRQSKKGRRCSALNQFCKSTVSDEVFNTISEELNVIGNVRETLDKYFEYANIHGKIKENEYDSHIKEYRDTNQEERTRNINKELNKLAIHKKLQKLSLNDDMTDFAATSNYPNALHDKNSVYPRIETVFAFKLHMNNFYVEAFINVISNQDGNESAILRIKK